MLDLLAEFTGPPPALTEPLIRIGPYPDQGESTVADFVTRCKEHRVLECAAELSARSPSQGDYYKRTDLRMLEAAIHAAPAAWAADISAVTATLNSFDLRTVYPQTLHTDQQQAGLAEDDGRLLTNTYTGAWDLKNQLIRDYRRARKRPCEVDFGQLSILQCEQSRGPVFWSEPVCRHRGHSRIAEPVRWVYCMPHLAACPRA
ncbi:hypothetical protein [Streptomyces sp. NPDC005953]|uniref:hypothetical protein n=1 Tax=Streptomyces sp. NPDC005953 TaxID=3156719 RepID=UPI00340E4C96